MDWKKHCGALEGLGRDQSHDGFVMFDHEVASQFDGLRWFGLCKPSMFLIDLFHNI